MKHAVTRRALAAGALSILGVSGMVALPSSGLG